MMGKYSKWSLAALALSASVAALNTAQANIVDGSVWTGVTAASSDATIANKPATTPDATFTLNSPYHMDSNVGGYSIGGFLGSNPGGFSFLTGSGIAGQNMDNTYWFFTGDVTVSHNEMFTVGHDDGLQLEIGGTLVVDVPGPTAFVTTPYTWTGASGTYAFQLSYGECCGPPAELEVSLPLSSVPEPSTWAMMLAGFGGLGFAAFRRSRRPNISIA